MEMVTVESACEATQELTLYNRHWSDVSTDATERPRAAAPCAMCGAEAELPHINCCNVDCNVLMLCCEHCKVELRGCCSTECRDNAPRLVRPFQAENFRIMSNYTPKQPFSRQRLMTPDKIAKLAEARERRRARLKQRREEKMVLKQQRKQLARSRLLNDKS